MRRLGFVAVLLLSATAFASELYIIPAFARQRVSNGATSWHSQVLLTNPHEHPVDLELELTAGEVEEHGCRYPEFSLDFPTRLAPRQTRFVCMPFVSGGAFAFRASDTLIVTSEMVAWRQPHVTRQTVEPGRRWIEADERALIASVRIGSGARANLIVVNPGDGSITVRYRVIRTGGAPPVNHDYDPVEGSVDVAPRSMAITALPEGPAHDCGGLVPCGNAIEHEVTLESTGRFYAATSSIEHELDASFRSPHVLP